MRVCDFLTFRFFFDLRTTVKNCNRRAYRSADDDDDDDAISKKFPEVQEFVSTFAAFASIFIHITKIRSIYVLTYIRIYTAPKIVRTNPRR